MIFQSTPPRRGRRGGLRPRCFHLSISIHAPAKGATKLSRVECHRYPISIHAPAKGATAHAATLSGTNDDFNPRPREGGDVSQFACIIISKYFNPRPREGGDLWIAHKGEDGDISIHAPAKGATTCFVIANVFALFQSTPPRRGRR